MIVNERGFTLIELLVGAMVIGIIGAIVAPQFGSTLQAYRLNGAVKVVWGDLQKARLMAIKENRSIRVDFAGTSYNIVRVGVDPGLVFSRNLVASYPGVTVSMQTNTITFGSTGTAGGSRTVQVQSLGRTKTFTILTTGRIGNFS